ncbi:uncharacterized mitochondrial protein AtMg00810-like [Corylus avellana]|uniref:uncharacterized mitochondrial protein AtMg00810-like n=1 Tax=Corylus avellana TaxID=13451 RepID=UPI00286A83C7|nr:uncharacterized mitochondrial protein AtMg00810-like [Corylus avellana]
MSTNNSFNNVQVAITLDKDEAVQTLKANTLHAKDKHQEEDLSRLHFFLGIEATWTTDGLQLSQQSTVGSLQYLSLTWLDIAFAVNKVSQFMQDPRETHWFTVKQILRYLKATIDHTLCIHKCSFNEIIAYSNSNWAGCPDDHKSTSGYCVFLGRNMLSWSYKKQPTMSYSSKCLCKSNMDPISP